MRTEPRTPIICYLGTAVIAFHVLTVHFPKEFGASQKHRYTGLDD